VVVSRDNDSALSNQLIAPDRKLHVTSFNVVTEAQYPCGFLNSLPLRLWLIGIRLDKQIGIARFERTKAARFDPDGNT
jgi:hypothetical protein